MILSGAFAANPRGELGVVRSVRSDLCVVVDWKYPRKDRSAWCARNLREPNLKELDVLETVIKAK